MYGTNKIKAYDDNAFSFSTDNAFSFSIDSVSVQILFALYLHQTQTVYLNYHSWALI